eukprot:COSAG05_NODE_2612_length_2837_cov_2.529584_4_plen_126_part_00
MCVRLTSARVLATQNDGAIQLDEFGRLWDYLGGDDATGGGSGGGKEEGGGGEQPGQQEEAQYGTEPLWPTYMKYNVNGNSLSKFEVSNLMTDLGFKVSDTYLVRTTPPKHFRPVGSVGMPAVVAA